MLVLDRDADSIAHYQQIVSELRVTGIRAEMYLGGSGMNAQMKYADRRNAAAAVIVGSNERAAGQVTIKDLAAGAEQAKAIKDNAEYKAAKVGQVDVARADLVAELSKIPAIARMRPPGLMVKKSASERHGAMIRLVESRTVQRVTPPLLVPAGPVSRSRRRGVRPAAAADHRQQRRRILPAAGFHPAHRQDLSR